MTEKLLQFIWQFGYYNNASLRTMEGDAITILFPGSLNTAQGPDFQNARIRIGATMLAGSIELHLKTSDWRKHRHDNDKNYQAVILHVVFVHDEKINDMPVLELGSRISSLLIDRYAAFMDNVSFLPCGTNIKKINELVFSSWKERLLIERLTRKSATILQAFKQSNHHWEETFWWLLAKNFGSKTNGEAFEAMAKSIPVNILSKHRNSIHQIEALLLGQANLLNEDFTDEYPKLLKCEYGFLQKKYNLKAISLPMHFLRMRPGNFPPIRLAQLAMLIYTSEHLFSKILEENDVAGVRKLFAVTANDFWHYHYTLQQPSGFRKKSLGLDTINNLIINTVVPVLFSYAVYHKNEKVKENILLWLEQTPPEANHITNGFKNVGIANKSAYDSQALIELKNEYCAEKRCLACAVGNFLLQEAVADYKVVGHPISA